MGASPSPPGRRDLWILLAVAAFATLFPLPFIDRWIGLLDEGYIHELASDINRGRVLYRDIYVDNPLPVSFYLLAWWFRQIGTSVLSSRYLALLCFGAYAAAFFWIFRANLSRGRALGLVAFVCAFRIWAFPHWQVYGYAGLAAALVTCAAAVMMRAERSSSFAIGTASGILAGLAVLTKQDYGLAVSGGTGLALLLTPLVRGGPWWQPLRPALGVLFGVVLTLAPTLAWFASQNALDDLFAQTVLQPLRGAIGFAAYPRLPDLWPFFTQDPGFRSQIGHYFPAILTTLWWDSISMSWALRETALWDIGIKLAFWTPVASFTAGVLVWLGPAVRDRLRGEDPDVPAERLLLLGVAGGWLIAFPPPRDWTHLAMVLPAQIAVLVTVLRDVARRMPTFSRALDGALAVALAAFILVSATMMAELRTKMSWPIDSPRAGVFTDPQNGPLIDDVLAYARERSPGGAPFPVYPLQPMLPFLAGRDSAAGFHVIWPVQDPSRDERIIADLEERRPPAIVYSISQYQHLGRFQDNAAALYEYLVDHYEIERVFGRETYGPILVGLRRADDPLPGETFTPRAGPGTAAVRWPFDEAIAVLVGTAETPTHAEVELDVPADTPVLEFRYGINPDRWVQLHDGPFVFRAVASDGTERFVREVDPGGTIADRLWKTGRVDLSDLPATTTLRLRVDAARAPSDPDGLAGWGHFRWVSPGSLDEPS